MKNDKLTQDNLIFVELLIQKSREGHDMQSMYFKAFIIYTTIIGAILKFALDNNTPQELKQGLYGMGILISINGILVCIFGEKLRLSIVDELKNLNEMLGSPLVAYHLLHLKYTIIVSIVFVVFMTLGLLYLLFNTF